MLTVVPAPLSANSDNSHSSILVSCPQPFRLSDYRGAMTCPQWGESLRARAVKPYLIDGRRGALVSSRSSSDGRGHHRPAWRCPSAKASTTLGKLSTDSFRICPFTAVIRQRQGVLALVMKATTRSAPCGASARGVLDVSDMATSNGR